MNGIFINTTMVIKSSFEFHVSNETLSESRSYTHTRLLSNALSGRRTVFWFSLTTTWITTFCLICREWFSEHFEYWQQQHSSALGECGDPAAFRVSLRCSDLCSFIISPTVTSLLLGNATDGLLWSSMSLTGTQSVHLNSSLCLSLFTTREDWLLSPHAFTLCPPPFY